MKFINVTFIIIFISVIGFISPNSPIENNKRVKYSINNNDWKFIRADVADAYIVDIDESDWLSVSIPHDYNGGIDGVHNDVFNSRVKLSADEPFMYKGPAWYRTHFSIDKGNKGKRVFIEFEAVSLEAKVYLNDKFIGQHQGGYTSFEFDITNYLIYGEDNLLAVRVDNSNNPAIAPWMANENRAFPFSFDYAIYGGIYRDVWISITDPIKIEKVFNTATCGGQAPSALFIETKVKNYSDSDQNIILVSTIYDPDGKEVSKITSEKNIKGKEEVSIKQSEYSFGDVKYWEIQNPNLYKVISTVSYDDKIVDNYESVFGFRYYTLANNEAFTLNGKKVFIRGVNRHQDMKGKGYALSNEQHWNDAKLIKDAGFNFVRHAHYPADKEFVKACNELGLMLWLEIPLTGSTSQDPAFIENCKMQLREMIEQHYNNPSVILWGIGNESDRSGTNEAGSNKAYMELVDLAKQLDPDRIVTGCNYKYNSNQEIVDVYAPQDWSGWYSGSIDMYNPNAIIGEYGADVHYNNHSEEKFDINIDYHPSGNTDFWSQEYGCFLHEYKISLGESISNKFSGHFAWLAFDFASPRVDRGMNPIPYMNQKGLIMHDHKTPKDVYYLYQSMYREPEDYPMLYIVSESWKDRWTEPAQKDIWVYSNCDSVNLFNDYEREINFGSRRKNSGPRGDTRFQWDSVYVKYNVLYAEGWFKNEIVVRDTLILDNLMVKTE